MPYASNGEVSLYYDSFGDSASPAYWGRMVDLIASHAAAAATMEA